MERLLNIRAAALLLGAVLSLPCQGGGGPNFIEGTSFGSLYGIPFAGSIVLLVLLSSLKSLGPALALVLVSIVFLGLLSLTSGEALIGAVLFGPWLVFVLLGIVSMVALVARLLPEKSETLRVQGNAAEDNQDQQVQLQLDGKKRESGSTEIRPFRGPSRY